MKFELKDSHTLLEMARVGKIGSIEIMIYEGEGPVPHFHFYDRQTERKGCIRLDVPEYFQHGIYKDKLTRAERKNLNEWVRSFHSPFKPLGINLTVYQYMLILWDDNNPNYPIKGDPEIPDYLSLR